MPRGWSKRSRRAARSWRNSGGITRRSGREKKASTRRKKPIGASA